MGEMEDRIKAKAKECGYDGCGIIEAADFGEFLAQLDRRSRLFPHSGPFYDRLRRLAAPKEGIGWAKSIIVGLRRYDKYKIPDGLDRLIGKVYLVDGRLSHSREYDGSITFEHFLQEMGMRTAPNAVSARWSAVRAGLGKFRNNNFVYTARGSWNWFDTWVVDKELEYEQPIDSARFSCPEGCEKCVKACPTGALSAPLTMDATRCIAYLSFSPGSFPAKELRDQMGTWLYGCDLCQNVCPANAGTWQGNEEYFPEPFPLPELIVLENLVSMDEETYRAKIQPRFWYIGEDAAWQWRCNVIRAMANEAAPKYREIFGAALEDPHENVRKMAAWALEKGC
ncbi:MAG: 4Fe-4S double cluster binding domain-containing protein [Negativicutes bacterium]|nr:4Fe-4S double cluster binding domain-containing protein [Negativicutes bacterium]